MYTVEALIAKLQKLPPKAGVILSSDAEGNSYRPVATVQGVEGGDIEVERLNKVEEAGIAAHGIIVLYPR